MKRILTIVLALAMVMSMGLVLTSCFGNNDDNGNGDNGVTTTAPADDGEAAGGNGAAGALAEFLDNPEMRAAADALGTMEGMSMEISGEGNNNLVWTIQYGEELDSLAEPSLVEATLEAMDATMPATVTMYRELSGIDDLVLTMRYKNSAGEVVGERTFDAE